MTAGRPLPVWRSLLYVPVNVERFVAKALLSAADAIQLDLEDGIAPAEKNAARGLIASVSDRVQASGADVIVRINRPLTLAVRDIEASIRPSVLALSIPKVESPDHIRLLSETMAEAEQRIGMVIGATQIIAGIETPDAWFQMREIARSDPRLIAMLLGGEDFSTAVGMDTTPDNLLFPKQALVIAAAAAGILPLGIIGSFAEFNDLPKFRAMVRRSRQLGFRGSSCIHPNQVSVLNEEFGPGPEELAAAQELIGRFSAAQSDGSGAISLDGQMIDLPIVERARSLIKWHERIEMRRTRSIDPATGSS